MNQDRHHDDDQEFEGLLRNTSPWMSILLILSVAACCVLLLERTQSPATLAQHDDPTGRFDVLDTLTRASRDQSERVVLLLGDSVMRGNVLRKHGYPATQTPAYWARLLATESVAIYDLSLDGMLPSDMEVILRSLDALDVAQKIEVVLELSPRYLSKSYSANPAPFARPWLQELKASQDENSQAKKWRDDFSLVHHRLGLNPLRRELANQVRHPENAFLSGPSATKDNLGSLRIAQHFLESNTNSNSGQVAALRRIAQGLRESQRRSLFFTTPINGESFGLNRHPQAVVDAQLVLHRQTEILPVAGQEATTHTHVARHFDDKLFGPKHFIDHCHLTPEGNRILAQRILASLAIPSSQPYIAAKEVIQEGPIPRDGFGQEAAIHSHDHGAFLTPNHVLMSETIQGRPIMRLVNLQFPSAQTLNSAVIGAASIAAIVNHKPGMALIFLSSGTVLHFDMKGGLKKTAANNERFPWREENLVTTHTLGRIVIFGPKSRKVWSLQTESMTWSEHFQVPQHQTIRSFSIDENDEIFVLINTIAEGPSATGLCSFHLDDFLAGDITKIKNYFGNEKAHARRAWTKIYESRGLVQESPREDEIPISGARRVFALNQENRVLVAAPGYDSKSKNASDTLEENSGLTSLWNLNPAARVAYALLWPAETGLILDQDTRHPIKPGNIVAIDQKTGFVFSHWQGWRRLDSTRVMRFNWIYGTPPDPESHSLTAMGHTVRRREGSTVRVGFFGSSISGAVWPADVIRPSGLTSSMSFARSFESAYKRQSGDGPFAIEGVNMSMANGDLISIYATLLDINPHDINIAVIILDLASLGSPDSSKNNIKTLVERWPAIVRDENQRPVIDRWAGRFPKIRLGPMKNPKSSRTQTIRDAITEMTAYCKSRSIQPVFLDITAVDRPESFTSEFPIYGRHEDMDIALKVLSQLKIPVLNLKKIMGDQLPSLYPYNFLGDRHLRSHLIRAVGSALVPAIRPLVQSHTFRFERNEARKKEQAKSGFQRRKGAEIVDGKNLSQTEARRYHVALASTSVSREHGLRLVVDVRAAGLPQDPWRQALALFGLRAMGELEAQDRVQLRVVRFDRYNEYGVGLRSTKKILATYEIAPTDVVQAAQEYYRFLNQENSSRPSWLQ